MWLRLAACWPVRCVKRSLQCFDLMHLKAVPFSLPRCTCCVDCRRALALSELAVGAGAAVVGRRWGARARVRLGWAVGTCNLSHADDRCVPQPPTA